MTVIKRRSVLARLVWPAFPKARAQPCEQVLAWRPATPLGVNIEHFGHDKTLADGQQRFLTPAGISFIRGNYDCYTTPPGWGPGTFSSCVRTVLSVQTVGTEIELACDQGIYALAPGEIVVLSKPIPIPFANGTTHVLPAQTPLRSSGGDAGTFASQSRQTRPATIRLPIPLGAQESSPQPVTGTQVLHRNFWQAGDSVLRWEVANYTAQANAWLAQGFAFDHAGYGANWASIGDVFGLAAMQVMREGEWAYFAGLGWDPARTLISDENEASWNVYAFNAGGFRAAWNTRWSSYFSDVLYPRMRHHFPRHTLGFGLPAAGAAAVVPFMDWWPCDPNTLLRLHLYPNQATRQPFDPASSLATDAYLDFLQVTVDRLGIPKVYVQEVGLDNTVPGFAAAQANLRRRILARGWCCAPWALSDYANPFLLGERDASGLWVPNHATGAFGLT